MRKRESIGILVVLLLAASAAWGQDSSVPPPADSSSSNPQQPVPAFGPDNPAPPVNDNPPISGLDMPNLEPHAAPLNYVQAGVHASEALDSNVADTLGGSGFHSVTQALGSLELQRLWSHYALALDYLGGIGYYGARGVGVKQIEELGVNQKINWKRGQLGLRDAFSYQPEGSFGSSYGSVAGAGAGLSGLGSFLSGNGLGALGEVPRIQNVSLVDVVQNLTPKSSVTATGGYSFVHFLGNDPTTGTSFIGNSQITAQVGYNRLLGPHDQAAITYAFQDFSFSSGIAFRSHVMQLMWGHRISGRMDFLISAGPQFTLINALPTEVPLTIQNLNNPACVPQFDPNTGLLVGVLCPKNDLRISAAGRASLRYRFEHASLVLSYDHLITGGSGFFAGAKSDIARVDVERPLGRIWTVFSDIGYSRNTREQPLSAEQTAACTANPPACPSVTANTYSFDYAGAGMRRRFGRAFQLYASYQFNYLTFDTSFCGLTVPCNRISQRHVGTIGLDWTPRPMRLD
jgi:hypothetical protein